MKALRIRKGLGLFLFLGISLVVFFLIQVSTRKSSVILTDIDCKPPCWRGIMVGMKGTATIMEKLRNMEDVRTDSLTYLAGSVPEEGEIKAEFVNKKEYDIEINLVEDRVSSLSFYLNDHLRLDNFIRKYGEPGYVLLTERNADFLRSVTAHIYYPDIGACLRLTSFPFWIGSSEQYLINGTSRVTMVWYVEPGSTSMDRFNVCKVWQHSRIVNQEWRGYGFYRGSNDVQ